VSGRYGSDRIWRAKTDSSADQRASPATAYCSYVWPGSIGPSVRRAVGLSAGLTGHRRSSIIQLSLLEKLFSFSSVNKFTECQLVQIARSTSDRLVACHGPSSTPSIVSLSGEINLHYLLSRQLLGDLTSF
jgi:hypothetical protein